MTTVMDLKRGVPTARVGAALVLGVLAGLARPDAAGGWSDRDLFHAESPELSPIGDGAPQQYILSPAPRAVNQVVLDVRAVADLYDYPPLPPGTAHYIDVYAGGTYLGSVFKQVQDYCNEIHDVLTVAPPVWNRAFVGETVTMDFVAGGGVDPYACSPASVLTVVVDYDYSADCNGNAIPDGEEIATGGRPDCQFNGYPDDCDIMGGTSEDCDYNGVPDECISVDCNRNGRSDCEDIRTGFSNDRDGNGLPDECQASGSVACAEYASEDCNSDGICDVFQLSPGTDRNGNRRLDGCESPANDCDANFIVDDAEIAEGLAPDVDADGVIDWCELTVNPTTKLLEGFEDFSVVIPFDGQKGWHEYHAGEWTSAVVYDQTTNGTSNTNMPSEGMMYLKIKAADPANANIGFIVSPRQNFGDQDIEEWAWDLLLQGSESGGSGYKRGLGRVAIGVMDLCEFGPPTIGDTNLVSNVSGAFNVSAGAWTNNEVQFAGQGAAYTAEAGRAYLWNQTSQGNYTAESTTPTTLIGPLTAQPHKWSQRFTVRLRIMNGIGRTELWTSDYDSALTMRAAGDQWPDWTVKPSGQTLTAGGDRQMVIGMYPIVDGSGEVLVPAFGDDGKARVFVDNIRYTTANDCNHNGLAEGNATLLGTGANETWGITAPDANADYIPDTCQDCNTNSVIDTTEIAGKDLNGNGILDECDINPKLAPRPDKPYAGCIGYFQGAECKALFGRAVNETNRRGGGSCDANANGMPDEYEVTQGSGTDLNANGCLDAADIAQGSSADVNSNGVPDESEPDCNTNGVLDDIDLAGGTSDDNYPFVSQFQFGDGIPDECCTAQMRPPCWCTGPDFTGDGDVDGADYSFMQRCAGAVAGPSSLLIGGPPPTGVLCKRCLCACADLNSDGQVNDADITLFWLQLTGPSSGSGNAPPYRK